MNWNISGKLNPNFYILYWPELFFCAFHFHQLCLMSRNYWLNGPSGWANGPTGWECSAVNAVEQWLFNDVSDWVLATKSCSLSWVLHSIPGMVAPQKLTLGNFTFISVMGVKDETQFYFGDEGWGLMVLRAGSVNTTFEFEPIEKDLDKMESRKYFYQSKCWYLKKTKLSILVDFCFHRKIWRKCGEFLHTHTQSLLFINIPTWEWCIPYNSETNIDIRLLTKSLFYSCFLSFYPNVHFPFQDSVPDTLHSVVMSPGISGLWQCLRCHLISPTLTVLRSTGQELCGVFHFGGLSDSLFMIFILELYKYFLGEDGRGKLLFSSHPIRSSSLNINCPW